MALLFQHNGVTYIRGSAKADASMKDIRAAKRPRFKRVKQNDRWIAADERKLERLQLKIAMLKAVR